VRAATDVGCDIRIMSRRPRPQTTPPNLEWAQADIASGDGVLAAIDQVDAVLHAASDPRNAEAVDVEGTRRLVEAAHSAGVTHIAYISIVGIDDIPLGYYKRKRMAEEIITSSGVPHTILRVTQFHSFVEMLVAAAARFPLLMPLPTDFKYQSVADSEAAARFVQCLADGPRGRVADFGGPDVLTFGEIAEMWMSVKNQRKRLVHLPLPGKIAAGFRAGKNTTQDGEHGAIRWHEWLTEHNGHVT
jgi:uncharacterized protein YbjT (DUF2867 family)